MVRNIKFRVCIPIPRGNSLILDLGFQWIWWNGDDEGNEKNSYAIEFV
jgi:hypothetical protein